MSITPINNSYPTTAAATTAAVKKNTEASAVQNVTAKNEQKEETSSKVDKDVFIKSNNALGIDVTEQKRLTATQLEALQNQQAESLKQMLTSMMTNQADKARMAKKGLSGLNADLFSRLTVTADQKLAAQQAISEDGEWGVKAVAGRILDMAVSLSGGDSSKISELRDAVEKGFKQAGGQWGQKLPSICQDTYDEVQKRFDYWEENGSVDGYQYGKVDEDK